MTYIVIFEESDEEKARAFDNLWLDSRRSAKRLPTTLFDYYYGER